MGWRAWVGIALLASCSHEGLPNDDLSAADDLSAIDLSRIDGPLEIDLAIDDIGGVDLAVEDLAIEDPAIEDLAIEDLASPGDMSVAPALACAPIGCSSATALSCAGGMQLNCANGCVPASDASNAAHCAPE